MNTRMSQLNKLKKDYEKAIKKEGKGLLREEFNAFFKDHPEVLGFKWTQYTPHFNDGDVCTFGVNEAYFRLEGVPENMGENEDGWLSHYDDLDELSVGKTEYQNPDGRKGYVDGESREVVTEPATQEQKAMAKKLGVQKKAAEKFWDSIQNDDIFEAAFGDGIEVEATRKGFSVDEYSHD